MIDAKSLLRTTAVAAAMLCAAATSPALAKNWRGWNIHAPGYANTVALEDFAKAVGEKTKGELTLKVYNNAVLGDQPDAIEQTRNGALDFGNFNLGPMGPVVPITNVLSLPFVFAGEEQMHHVMDGPIGKEFADAIEKKGLVVLSWFDSGARSMFNDKHPIEKPADVKGLKIRVMDNQLYVDMIGAMGGNDRVNHVGHIATGQVMGFEPSRGDSGLRIAADTRLQGHDAGLHNHAGIHLAEAHADQAGEADASVRHVGLEPDAAISGDRDQKEKEEDRHEEQAQIHQPAAEIGLSLGEQKHRERAHDLIPSSAER